MSFQRRIQAIVSQATLISLISLNLAIFATHAAPLDVTLIRFSATSLPGQPEIYVEWETATEFDTLGFFVMRGNLAQGPYTRISDFIPHEGNTLTGAQYGWIDRTATLGHTYYYRLEEITVNQTSIFYEAVPATSGSPVPLLPIRAYLPLLVRSN